MATETKKEKVIVENVLADVTMMGITKGANSLTNKYRKFDDQHLNGVADRIQRDVKVLSGEAVPLTFEAGKPVDVKAFKDIADSVDAGNVKKFTKKVPTYSKSGELLPEAEWTEKTYVVNVQVTTYEQLLEADELTEAESLNFRGRQEGILSDLSDIRARKGYLQAERNAIISEKHQRNKAKIEKAMAKRKIKTQSLKDMYLARFPTAPTVQPVAPVIPA